MTSLYSASSHNQQPLPPPLDQPTPQSPPSLMNPNHASSKAITMDKQQQFLGASPQNYSGNRQHSSIPSANSSLPTPGNTVLPMAQDDDVVMDDGGFSQAGPNKRRRTSSSYDAQPPTVAPGLRHREDGRDDAMSDAPPPLPNIQEILSNPDVSPYYLVCQKPHEQAYPDMTENLLELYGLKHITEKVARFDATGKKNKLRKSYKGFINTLAGKNEVVARQTNLGQTMEDHDLGHLLMFPEEEWQNRNVHGKELSKGIDMGKLRKGLAGLSKGDIPGFDPSVLGLDDDAPRRVHQGASPAQPVGTPRVNGSTPGNASTVSGGAYADDRLRKNKRRRYDEGSYEGYDGFDGDEDPNAGAGGSGTGPGGGWDAQKKKKKRKKNPGSPGTPGMNIPRSEIPVHSGYVYGR